MRLPVDSENQMFPSEPTAMPWGEVSLVVGKTYLRKLPLGDICPTALPLSSVNQMLPSGPLTTSKGARSVKLRLNSVTSITPVQSGRHSPMNVPFFDPSSQTSMPLVTPSPQ